MVFFRVYVLIVPFVSSLKLPNVSDGGWAHAYVRSPVPGDLSIFSRYVLRETPRWSNDGSCYPSRCRQSSSSFRSNRRCVSRLSGARHLAPGERRSGGGRYCNLPPGESASDGVSVQSHDTPKPSGEQARTLKVLEGGNEGRYGPQYGGGLADNGPALTRGQWFSGVTAAGIVSALMIAGSASSVQAATLEVRALEHGYSLCTELSTTDCDVKPKVRIFPLVVPCFPLARCG